MSIQQDPTPDDTPAACVAGGQGGRLGNFLPRYSRRLGSRVRSKKVPFSLQKVSLLEIPKSSERTFSMRIPANCKICGGPAITYCSVRGSQFTTRYRRCRCCGATSKSISVIPILFSSDIGHLRQDIGETSGVQFTLT